MMRPVSEMSFSFIFTPAVPDEGLDDRQQGKRRKPGRFINLRPNDFEI